MKTWRTLSLLGVVLFASPAVGTLAGEVPDAVIVVEAAPGTPGSEPTAAPPRFVLTRSGEVFVGGTSRIESGRLDSKEVAALRKRAEAARKALGRGWGAAAVGDARKAVRLRLLLDGPTEVAIDPATAPPALRPVAELVTELLQFEHPSLVPFVPASYALVAREGALVGGCRSWTFTFPMERALASAVAVPAADVIGWPTGAMPASVCVGARRFVVTLRPLLPGELP